MNCPKCKSDDFHWRRISQCYDCAACGELFSPGELLDIIAAMTVELTALRANLAACSTKDGAAVCPSRMLWEIYRGKIYPVGKLEIRPNDYRTLFSTLEAAEQELEKRKSG